MVLLNPVTVTLTTTGNSTLVPWPFLQFSLGGANVDNTDPSNPIITASNSVTILHAHVEIALDPAAAVSTIFCDLNVDTFFRSRDIGVLQPGQNATFDVVASVFGAGPTVQFFVALSVANISSPATITINGFNTYVETQSFFST